MKDTLQSRIPMRKREREITDREAMDEIIRQAAVCRLAFSDNNVPYIVPMNFGYKGDCLYFHTGQEGRKIDMIRRNNLVCFEMEADYGLVKTEKPCAWSMRYASIVGLGRASFVENRQDKKEALDIIMEHYGARGPFEYPEGVLERVAILKVLIETISGKRSKP
jgi:nitroimidazol reductase NimA-like FMN-containing flavoprotein (pyridoxamine 5'-phosphate oxidase superfamily)